MQNYLPAKVGSAPALIPYTIKADEPLVPSAYASKAGVVRELITSIQKKDVASSAIAGLKLITGESSALGQALTGSTGQVISQGLSLLLGGKTDSKSLINVGIGALTAINPIAGGIASLGASLFEDVFSGLFKSKSNANWDRTIGRFYRAGAPVAVTQRIYWLVKDVDPTGAKVWELAVDILGVEVETKQGTKHGYTRNPPIPQRDDSALKSYLAAVKSSNLAAAA
jgi:hypothetical protein